MIKTQSTSELIQIIDALKAEGKSIGFTPTMGALHHGHLSLISLCKSENDISICSVFVNPTQFNEKSDLDKYPRDLDKDADLLGTVNNDILYAPSVSGIYPDGLESKVDIPLGNMLSVLEAAHRPGHFEGVLQVVKRLLDIVRPDNLYMGQKDFQQFSLIQKMITHLAMPTQLRVCPIIREANGVAMSSRNQRLSKTGLMQASIIHYVMSYVKQQYALQKPEDLKKWAMDYLKTEWCEPEYFEISDGYSLENVNNREAHDYVVASTAAWIEGVRLIDNMILLHPSKT